MAYPATTNYYQQVLSKEHRHDDDPIHAVHPADVKHERENSSRLQLSIKHEHDKKERQVLGCQMGIEVKPCGSFMVVTVKCRKQSVTGVERGVISPTCIPQKNLLSRVRESISYSLFMQILNKNEGVSF